MFKHMGAILALGLILGLALGSPAYAADRVATGRVNRVAGFDAASTFSDTVELTGVAILGACPTDSSTGLVIFRFAGNTDGTNPSYDRIYAILFTSYTQGKTVTIDTDDSSGLLNGDCTIKSVSLNPT